MPTTRRGFLGAILGGAAASAVGPTAEGKTLAPEVASDQGSLALRTTLDGFAVEDTVGEDTSALDWIRGRGKTGPKLACGHGACGACVIRVDGTPVASCLLPAVHLEGRTVATLDAETQLHAVQRAFAANDALQCGYCTPGFVAEAIAFYDARKGSNPTRADVADAFTGHLCRCGAYPAIYEAILQACAGRFDGPDYRAARPDALEKVTGKARYTVDHQPAGLLEGRILRSTIAAGSATVDVEPARAVPGVRAAIALHLGKIRFAGQELAAVAADTAEAAEAGLAAIRVVYSATKPVIGMDAALATDAPRVYEDKPKHPPSASEGLALPAKWEGNTRGPASGNAFAKPGKARKAVDDARAAGTVVEARFETAAQAHTPLEPRAVVAEWSAEKLVVHSSTQAVRGLADDLAERFDLRRDAVEVHAEYVGGGFGSKVGLSVDVLAAVELSKAAGKPVKIVASRAEELAVGGLRPAQRIDLAMAFSDDEISGLVARSWADSGVAVGASVGFLLRLQYKGAERDVEDTDVLTNSAAGKPFRGPGGPPAFFALESLVDAWAHRERKDPIAARRAIDHNPVRKRLYTAVETTALWRDRPSFQADKGRFRRGIGLATAGWPYFVTPFAQVRMDASPDGLVVSTAAQDMGNGTRAVLEDAVLGVFALPRDMIRIRVGDSRDVPGPMSAGSRTTASLWPAARKAALDLRDALADSAGRGRVATAQGLGIGEALEPWAALLASAPPLTVVARRPRDEGGYFLPVTLSESKIGEGLNGSVSVCEVEVDTRLGRIRPLRAWVGLGSGRLVAPKVARSQAEGGVVQGISYALYEDRRLCPRTGRLLAHNLEDYRIMGLGDCPEIDVHFDTEAFPGTDGPIGISEVATCAHAGAVANAVFHATGWRPTQLPITPERVLAGVRA